MSDALVVGSTYKFRLTATKDEVAWNLTSATVLLYLKKPDLTVLTKTATVTNGAGGIAEFTCATSDLSVVGNWSRAWKVTDGSVVQESAPIAMPVIGSP